MIKKGSDSGTNQSNDADATQLNGNEDVPTEDDGDVDNYPEENEEEDTERKYSISVTVVWLVEASCNVYTHFSANEPDKEENKVFVWNNFSEEKEEGEEYPDEENRSKSPASEASLVGYEIAPGIGSVISNNNEDSTEQMKYANLNVDVSSSEVPTKKVLSPRGSTVLPFRVREN